MDRERARRMWAAAWPHLRALLIFYHVYAIIALSLPSPRRMTDRAAWKTEPSQQEFARWAENLDAIGFDLTPQQLESKMWSLAQSYVALRRKLIAPVDHYRRYLGTGQGWRMFSRPQIKPGRVHIELMRVEGGAFESLFIEGDSEHDWRRHQFRHNRMRKLFGRLRRNPRPHAFNAFAEWIAKQAAREFPDAHAIRIRLERWRTLRPDRIRAGDEPEKSFTLSRVFVLERLR